MSIPNGYKLVPVEPTEEMMCAGMDVSNTRTKWQVMLASAPIPPQPIYDEAKERDLFEAWAYSVCHVPYGWLGREYFKRAGDHYEDDYAHGLWQGWKACAKAGEVGHG